MSSKLTLNIRDKELIEEAKLFAKSQNKSLSVLIENMLRGLVGKGKSAPSSTDHKLLGAFVPKTPQKKENSEDVRWEYLKKKYDL